MMKKLFSLALAVFFMVHSPVVFAEEGQPKFLEFKKYKDMYDGENINKSVTTLQENYSYFKPSTQGVSVRKGPGVDYKKFGTLSEHVGRSFAGANKAEFSNLQNIDVDSSCLPWVGGIVSNTIKKIELGKYPFSELMNLVSDDPESIKNMQAYMERNGKKFRE